MWINNKIIRYILRVAIWRLDNYLSRTHQNKSYRTIIEANRGVTNLIILTRGPLMILLYSYTVIDNTLQY